MRTRRATPFALLGLSLARASVAAEGPLEPPDLSRYVRWGPAHVRPGFAVPSIGFDDNVFSRSGNNTVGDYTARLSPRLEGVMLFGKSAFVTFHERLDYTAYEHYHGLNYFENLGSARVTFPLRRMGFFVDGTLNRLKDPVASELDSRPIRTEARLGAGVILRLGWRADAEIGVVRSRWTATDPGFLTRDGFTIGDLSDRVDLGRRVKLRYRATGLTRLTLDATDRTITFDNPLVGRNSSAQTLVPGVEFGEGGRLSGVFQIGRARLNAKTPGEPDFSGLISETKLIWRLSTATSVRLEEARLAGFAVYEGNRYYLNSLTDARVVHYLNRVFGVEAGAGRGRLSFPESFEAHARTDRLSRYDAGVRLRLLENDLGRTVEYTFGFTKRRRDSSVPSLNQSRTTVGFGVAVGF